MLWRVGGGSRAPTSKPGSRIDTVRASLTACCLLLTRRSCLVAPCVLQHECCRVLVLCCSKSAVVSPQALIELPHFVALTVLQQECYRVAARVLRHVSSLRRGRCWSWCCFDRCSRCRAQMRTADEAGRSPTAVYMPNFAERKSWATPTNSASRACTAWHCRRNGPRARPFGAGRHGLSWSEPAGAPTGSRRGWRGNASDSPSLLRSRPLCVRAGRKRSSCAGIKTEEREKEAVCVFVCVFVCV